MSEAQGFDAMLVFLRGVAGATVPYPWPDCPGARVSIHETEDGRFEVNVDHAGSCPSRWL